MVGGTYMSTRAESGTPVPSTFAPHRLARTASHHCLSPSGQAEAAAGSEGEGEGGEDADVTATTTARREVKWGLLPEGLQPAPKPAKLDGSLVGQLIYRRWETPHGWLLGKIDKKFDQSTPRLFKKFNYRIKWYDGWENHMLLLDDYNHGPTAPYKSWVLLEKPADIEVVA